MHPADPAFILEGLEPEDRLRASEALEPRQAAEVMVEVEASVRTWLIRETPDHRLIQMAESLDPDDLAWIADDLPEEIMREVRASISEVDRTLLQQADAYPAQSVGRLMSLEVVTVRETRTVAEVLATCRCGQLPERLDRLFVVDAGNCCAAPSVFSRSSSRKPDTGDRRRHGARPAGVSPDGSGCACRPCVRALRSVSCRSSTIAASSSDG